MENDSTDKPDGQDFPPERSMQDCLFAGLSYADFNIEDLDEDSQKLIRSVGEMLVKQRTGLALPKEIKELAELLTEFDKDPWFAFGVDYELGHAGTYRVMDSFPRFRNVIPVYVGKKLDSRAQRYLKEAIGCYLLQFDVACIVFCRAAVESLLKEALREKGHALYRDAASSPTAGKVIDDAFSSGLVRNSVKSARRLKRSADHALHRAVPDEKILPQQALDSINDLAAVLAEVLELESR